jgi:hypothetical protein
MLPAGCHPDKPARSAANPFHWAIEAASTSAAAFEHAPDRWLGWGWLRAEHRSLDAIAGTALLGVW